LYFIATGDPTINISRVRSRVKPGGHAVPEDRIEKRYHRSLDLLMAATRHTNRAYVSDNSGYNQNHTWLAEIIEGRELEMKTNRVPAWFKRAVLDKINPPTQKLPLPSPSRQETDRQVSSSKSHSGDCRIQSAIRAGPS
jgi:hypothetical protein